MEDELQETCLKSLEFIWKSRDKSTNFFFFFFSFQFGSHSSSQLFKDYLSNEDGQIVCEGNPGSPRRGLQ